MDWQLIVVGIAIAVSAVFLVRSAWRESHGCKGCSCKSDTQPATLISSEDLLARMKSRES